MISLSGRLKSKTICEKIYVLFYFIHLAIIGGIFYFVFQRLGGNEWVFDFSTSEKFYMIATLWFSLTTMNASLDYKNIKKTHHNTLDYYIADLNLSRGSLPVKVLTDKSPFYDKFIGGIFAWSLMILLFAFFMSFFDKVEGSTVFLTYNFCLIILSTFLGGADIRLSKVDSQKLNSIDDIIDITDEEKLHFRREIGKILEVKNYVTRLDVFELITPFIENIKKRKEDAYEKNIYKDFEDKNRSIFGSKKEYN